MTLATAGSSIGSIVHPIMLNNLFYTRLGFAGSVRVSAALVSGLLIIACLLMRPRLPPPMKRPSILRSVRRFYQEPAFVALSVGYAERIQFLSHGLLLLVLFQNAFLQHWLLFSTVLSPTGC